MNRSLLKSLSGELPAHVHDLLEGGKAVCLQFNRHGNIIVTGTKEGHVVLWDMDTRSIAKNLAGHTAAVTSVSFAAPGTGQHVYSGSADGTVRYWDVLRETATVVKLQATQVIASPIAAQQVVIIPGGELPKVVVFKEPPEDGEDLEVRQSVLVGHEDDAMADSRKKQEFVVTYTRSGKRLLRGGANGLLKYFHVAVSESGEVSLDDGDKVELPNRSAVKGIAFSRDDSRFLVNSQDRCIRVYDAQTLYVMASFQDVINRYQWRCAMFSGDGDYVLGAATGTEHRLNFWRLADSRFVKTLEGPKEGISGMLWHPRRPLVVSLGVSSGGMYLWVRDKPQDWKAFAPKFKEIDENQEYDEREDEFDLPNPAKIRRKLEEKLKKESTTTVDVVTVDSDSNDGDQDVPPFYLPAVPEVSLTRPTGHLKKIARKSKERKVGD